MDDLSDLSDEDFWLITVVNNVRNMGQDLSPDTADQVAHLAARGLVATDQDGHFIPSDVQWRLMRVGRILKRT